MVSPKERTSNFHPPFSITLDMTRSTLEQILAPMESRIQSEHSWMAEDAAALMDAHQKNLLNIGVNPNPTEPTSETRNQ